MKKKSTLRFPLSRKGYDREAVDGFIALEQAKNDELQLEQRERINALKQENDALKLQVETLKGREEQIKLALVTATENANRLSQDVKLRYKQYSAFREGYDLLARHILRQLRCLQVYIAFAVVFFLDLHWRDYMEYCGISCGREQIG